MTLLEFYRHLVKSLGLGISDKDLITPSQNDTTAIFRDGLPLALPTKEHLNSVYDKNEDGEIVATKILYNPLSEDIVKGDTASLKATKDFARLRLLYTVASLGEMLLTLAATPELQNKTPLKINKFLAAINKAQNQGIKKLVDDKSIDNWAKICNNATNAPDGLISIFLKKRGKYQGVEYNRLAVISSSLYDELKDAPKDPTILGVKLRNKDAIIFKIILEFLLKDIEVDGTISIGSNDPDSPAFIALIKAYLKIQSRAQDILEALEGVNDELYDTVVIKDLMDSSVLDNIAQFKSELLTLPNDNDLNRSAVSTSRLQLSADQFSTQAQPGKIQNQAIAPTAYPTEIQPREQSTQNVDPLSRVPFDNYYSSLPNYQQQPTYGYDMYQQPAYGYNYQAPSINQVSPTQDTVMTLNATPNVGYNPYPNAYPPMGNGRWI